jgi:hypothetical protein
MSTEIPKPKFQTPKKLQNKQWGEAPLIFVICPKRSAVS